MQMRLTQRENPIQKDTQTHRHTDRESACSKAQRVGEHYRTGDARGVGESWDQVGLCLVPARTVKSFNFL